MAKYSKQQWKMGIKMSEEEYLKAHLLVRAHGRLHRIPFIHIRYIQGNGNASIIHLRNNTRIPGSYCLTHYSKLLPAGFFGRYHKFAILNLAYICDYTNGSDWAALMSPSQLFPINSKSQKAFLRDFHKHSKKHCFFCSLRCFIYKHFLGKFPLCLKSKNPN